MDNSLKKRYETIIFGLSLFFAIFVCFFLFSMDYITLTSYSGVDRRDSETAVLKYRDTYSKTNSLVYMIDSSLGMEDAEGQIPYEKCAFHLILIGIILLVIGAFYFQYERRKITLIVIGSLITIIGSVTYAAVVFMVEQEIKETLGIFGSLLESFYTIETTAYIFVVASIAFSVLIPIIYYKYDRIYNKKLLPSWYTEYVREKENQSQTK